MAETALLFVYGTLRRNSGHSMGRWLAAHAEWAGPACCAPARLYRVDWYPALVPGSHGGETVVGDLYHLHEAGSLWPVLDEFEGVAGRPEDEYERGPAEVASPDGVRRVAWTYWYRRPVDGLARIGSGDWLRA